MAWHPDGHRLAAACDDFKIHLWDADAGREVMPAWTGHANYGIHMAFNHAGDRLVSNDWNRQTLLWDTVSGQVLLTMPGNFGIQFSQDDALLGPQQSGGTVRLRRVNAGRELRVLRHRTADGGAFIWGPIPDPDGRVLAAMSGCGLSFFDLASGEELASVPMSRPEYTHLRCFISPGGWVMTRNDATTLSWPMQPEPDRPHELRVGPPRQLAHTRRGGTSASPDGAVMAHADGDSTIVQHRDPPHQRFVLEPQNDVRHTAMSSDKRWVVTCSFESAAPHPWVRIWNPQTGTHVHDLPLHTTSWSGFSPLSHWLATTSKDQDCRLWEVETWREVRRYVAADVAFSSDESTLALNDVHGQVRLVETATDREIARLTGPEPIWYNPACFSRDGTRLVAVARDSRAIYIWDLRSIRQQLKELDLDWDWPEFAPAPPPGRPLRVHVDAGFLEAELSNESAWKLLTCPEKDRQPDKALVLARKAVELVPDNSDYRNTLGVAYYRLGRWRDAVATLEPNLERNAEGAAWDFYILAMSYHQLSDAAKAKDYFQRAVRWHESKEKNLDDRSQAELKAFRAVAKALLE